MATAIPSHSSASLAQLRFGPPSERFGFGSMGMALLAHALLIAALTWGISWHSKNEMISVSAELWAATPTEAAPPLPPPPPPSPPVTAEVVHTPELPTIKAPDIVIEKKNKKEILKKELPKKEPPKKELNLKAKKEEAEFEHQQELARQDQMKRMAGLAGTAKQSSGPSASYAGKVKAKIRPNIVFQDVDSVANNAAAEVDIRVAPDGTIMLPPKISKSSGNKSWDNAVLRAIEKTETLPHDTDGRVPPNMTLIMRPKE